ncbi:LysR family transcriptional regulator [Acidisoma silvae]|uniref:LysR family transcriptional regulator n=1 Tax=Acidisoma silvae TaxID=2802396 RepID=A0A963YS99_9PROT|nr:LysR family transcriptional regulator [Acidisoma silvae]MCB8876006.1 LysR family transcriptional regulator [Acidisoma silvae]
MLQGNMNDLVAFLAVATERSFTKAAAKLGVSQPALSQTIRQLEERLDLRLLVRTTRSVSPTEAGEKLIQSIGPRFADIEEDLNALRSARGKPTGMIRITVGDHAATTILWPKLVPFLKTYPDIGIELTTDYGLRDIVAERYDAGVRLGGQVAKDMIAVRIAPDIRFIIVGSPAYFAGHAPPRTPQDLPDHSCINLRLPTYGGLYPWELEKDGVELKVRAEGRFVFNSTFSVLDAAVAGFGLAHVPEDIAAPYVKKGKLRQVLQDWSPAWPGYHLYYPSRRQSSPAFSLLVNALRHRD